MSVLVCENINKSKKKNEIIYNFSYNFLDNQIYAILGNNNEIQNELLNLLSAKEKPTAGSVYLDGELLYNNDYMCERLCYISSETTFPGFIKVKDIIVMISELFPKWDNAFAYEMINHFNINTKVAYSKLSKNK